jgi:dynein heavy chain, axonemal
MLANYNAVLQKIAPSEWPLLTSILEELKSVLKPGFDALNWNSLGIPDFIKKCDQEISKFQSIVNQIQKNASMVSFIRMRLARCSE